MQNTKKSLENSPDTSTCDSTVQTINTVTFITCPAEYLSMSTSKVKIKKMWCVILVQSVILSAMCLNVWLHGSNKHTEIPRYEVLRLGFAHTSTQMRTLRALATAVWQMDTVRRSPEDFKWSTDRVHLSYSAACYRNGTMQLLVRTKILDHRVRFDRFLTTFVHAFSFVRIAATFIFISFSFCVPPLVLVFVI